MTTASVRQVVLRATASREGTEPWLSTVLRVVAHSLTAGVLAWPLTVEDGVVAGAIGGAVGALLARPLATSRVRSMTVAAGGLLAIVLVVVLHGLVVDHAVFPRWLGPAGALRLGEVVTWGGGALFVCLLLRTGSLRRPALSILEAATVATSFATLLIAHRNGAIHRPFELADPLIQQNYDPTLALLGVGVLGAAVIGTLLLTERNVFRAGFHIAAVLFLLVMVFMIPVSTGLPTPIDEGGAALALRDDDSNGGANGQRRNADELGFLDDYPSGGTPTPDAVVIFHDDYSPPSETYYFRQTAFSQYNGLKLVASTVDGANPDVGNLFPVTRSVEVRWTPPEDDRRAIETTVGLLQDNSAPVGLEAPLRFAPSTNPAPERFRRVYRTYSLATDVSEIELLGRAAGDPTWPAALAAHYVEGPEDPRYRELASNIVSNLPPDLMNHPIVQASAISQYLSHHGIYSLRSRHAAAADPTADFLFGDLTGYCVHFAHAAVFLMRAVGLPARVATGYAVAESRRQGGSAILLMNSDQHAWPEVYIEGTGWVVVDVYPETVLSQAGGMTDAELQRLLAEMLRGAHRLDDAPSPPIPVGQLVRSLWGPVRALLLTGLPSLFGLLVLLGYAIKLYRRRARTPRTIYRAALDRLSEAGFRRAFGESPEAFARRVRAQLPALGGLTDEHLRAAFGRRDAAPDLESMRRDAARVTSELGRAVPAWRVWLGIINPYSWLLTR